MATDANSGSQHGTAIFDSLAKFYAATVILWTSALAAGAVFLIANRHEHCVRIRNLPLALSSVSCLHVYWVLCMLVYSLKEVYPCVAEYWIMSIYFPLGIALFQANSMQLLSVCGIQQKLLYTAQHSHRSTVVSRSKSGPQRYFQWKNMSLLRRTEFGIAVGMVVQVVLSLSIFLASRKFHDFGTFSHAVSQEQCRRGPEWIPSTLWQFFWAWIFAPYVLWKIRNIQDTHYWRLQITCCVIAALPGSPLWLAGLYSHSETWTAINKYWGPPLWFAPGIMTMEAVTIFFPCYEIVLVRRQRDRIHKIIREWNEKRLATEDESSSGTSRSRSDVSRRHEVYSIKALNRYLAEDTSALLQFAAVKEFSAENIIFLNYVRDWKAAWAPSAGRNSMHEDARQSDASHRHFFKVAAEIYTACVDMKTAPFPINIESAIYVKLKNIFGEAAKLIDDRASQESDETSTRNYTESYPMTVSPNKRASAVAVLDDDTHALCLDDYIGRSQDVMHMAPRVPDHIFIPSDFNIRVFDDAEKSIRRLVLTNTWPKFVDSSYDVSLSPK